MGHWLQRSPNRSPHLPYSQVGYWLQRPQLIELLREKAAAEGVELLVGHVAEARFDAAGPYAELKVEIGVLTLYPYPYPYPYPSPYPYPYPYPYP